MSPTAPPLAELQRLFHGHVRSAGTECIEPIRSAVVADERGSAAERIGIYVDAFRLRLTEALSNDYPALRTLLGVSEFERLCAGYIAAHPSTTPSIRWLGRHLSEYVATAADYAKRPVLAELALFEWKQGETFDSPDAELLGIQQVAAILPAAWPGMCLIPHPSVRRLDLRWNAPEIAKAVADKSKKRTTPKQFPQAKPWLMWRDAALDIRWRSMSDDEAAAFDAIVEHRSFADLCELLCDHVDAERAPMHAASLLKRWVIDGLITDVDLVAALPD